MFEPEKLNNRSPQPELIRNTSYPPITRSTFRPPAFFRLASKNTRMIYASCKTPTPIMTPKPRFSDAPINAAPRPTINIAPKIVTAKPRNRPFMSDKSRLLFAAQGFEHGALQFVTIKQVVGVEGDNAFPIRMRDVHTGLFHTS